MPSRWDTPSPSPSDNRNRKSATPSDYSTGRSHNYRGRAGFHGNRGRVGSQSRGQLNSEDDDWNNGRGRGRKRKKFNKKKQGKK